MADIKLSALDHLKLVALRGKADANERIAELAEAISAVIEELDATKAEADHTHESMGGGTPNVAATSSDGATYTATADGVTELTKGLTIVITPNTTSTTTLPKLNLNGLGAKNIKQGLSVNTSLTVQAQNADWLIANKPVLLMYDGLQWKTVAVRSSGDDMYGTVTVAHGGTGANTAAEALANLLPTGGTEGQILTLDADGAATWGNAASGLPSGGTEGQVLTVGADGIAYWADAVSVPSAEGVEF